MSVKDDNKLIDEALAGRVLYGDDFNEQEIRSWYEDEREGYFNLVESGDAPGRQKSTNYEFSELTELHLYRWLPRKQYSTALGIGSADGVELLPILPLIDSIVILEPSDGFKPKWRGNKEVRFMKPDPSGRMKFLENSFDLIVCLSVLHHIPNVRTVLGEIYRVLKPGGFVLLREPTHSMGDWRKPREGLTKRERGIPVDFFRSVFSELGFQVIRETRSMHSLIAKVGRMTGHSIWRSKMAVVIDSLICRVPIWANAYHPTTAWERLRPTAVSYVLTK